MAVMKDGYQLQVLDKHQQDQERQDGHHVEANVQDGGQHQDLPGVTAVGDHVGFFHYLMQSIRKDSAARVARLNTGCPTKFQFKNINR